MGMCCLSFAPRKNARLSSVYTSTIGKKNVTIEKCGDDTDTSPITATNDRDKPPAKEAYDDLISPGAN